LHCPTPTDLPAPLPCTGYLVPVATRILLVRAVNVGGATLPMAQFRELLASLGAGNVRTYIASGNAVVDVPGDHDVFDRSVERAVEQRYGYRREVMSRSLPELIAGLANHPFEVLEPKYSYLTFLSAAPAPAAIDAAQAVRTGDDQWQVVGRELHLRYVNGAGRAVLNLDTLLRRLGVVGTARNLRTVQALIDLAAT
jgi:uncharacterized protein (DUF1697 family)